MNAIFISYRRDDVPDAAGRIAAALRRHFGDDSVFCDVDSLAAGSCWTEEIEACLRTTKVVLALVGPNYAPAMQERDVANDWVRKELQLARETAIPIWPILCGGANTTPRNLPDDAVWLGELQSRVIRHQGFDTDVRALTDDIAKTFALSPVSSLWDKIKLTKDPQELARFVACSDGHEKFLALERIAQLQSFAPVNECIEQAIDLTNEGNPRLAHVRCEKRVEMCVHTIDLIDKKLEEKNWPCKDLVADLRESRKKLTDAAVRWENKSAKERRRSGYLCVLELMVDQRLSEADKALNAGGFEHVEEALCGLNNEIEFLRSLGPAPEIDILLGKLEASRSRVVAFIR